MRLLLDTHLLLWAAGDVERLSSEAGRLIEDEGNVPVFSVASLWEITIKSSQGRADFDVDPWALRRALMENDYEELAIGGEHVVAVGALPAIHKDPFDRLLVAQATVEGLTLLTSDAAIARYPGPIRLV